MSLFFGVRLKPKPLEKVEVFHLLKEKQTVIEDV